MTMRPARVRGLLTVCVIAPCVMALPVAARADSAALARTTHVASWRALRSMQRDSVTICLEDAHTHAPLSGAQIADVVQAAHPDAPGASAVPRIAVGSCLRVANTRVLVRRVGYHARTVALSTLTADRGGGSTTSADWRVMVSLTSLSHTRADASAEVATQLTVQRVVADAEERRAGRLSSTVTVASARRAGVGTTTGLLALLPFVALRSARGESGVSLRGARSEQVVIMLDGMPLNDPATGIADVSDIALSSLGSATVALGADPLGVGPGASGGVLALESSAQRVIAARAGAFGEQHLEGAWHRAALGARWQVSASHRRADNDFPFFNDAGATSKALREHRVNNDEQRSTLSVGATGEVTQWSVMASTGERGMVGPANVRTYDADRSRTQRLLVRGQHAGERVQWVAGARVFTLDYRDPTRPELNATARARAGEIEGRTRTGAIAWRVGGGADDVLASGGIAQARGRAFAVASFAHRDERNVLDAGIRTDAVGAFGALPSFSLGAERVWRGSLADESLVAVGARLAQAVRVPTLYDLYFSSPQRLFVRTLRPERVRLDAELLSRVERRTPMGVLTLHASVVARDTRDAIIWFPGNFGWSPANVGMERLRGGEARAQLSPRWGTASLWVTRYNAMLTSGALQIPTPYVARLAGGGQLQARRGATSAGVFIRAMGPRPFTAGPRNPAFELPSAWLSDVSLSHRLVLSATEALVSLSLDNAMGVRWQAVRGFPSPGRSWAISTTLRQRP